MYVLMQCVAEAVVAKGVRGLVELVPGGGFIYDVANEAHRRLRDRRRADEIRNEVVAVAAAGIEEVRKVAEEVVQQVAKNAPPEEKAALELYLTQVPGAIRQSFRRAEDPSGKSVPDQFALADPADLARRLPSKLPKFRPGDALPGRPGWVLGELLGSGGFGEVWLARNPSLAALKGAVKFGTDPQARERLLRHEGGLVSRVMEEGRHPNIVPLLDAYLDGDAPWLMYEYVSGGELGTLIPAWQNLPAAERNAKVVSALRTLAAAVGHFHRLAPPLVHRDLKPANILVRPAAAGPQLLVADFGIGGVAADAALAAETNRRSSGYLGSQLWGSHTPLYASPQQQRGEKPDPRDDVHALGVIGYQMLTGKLDTAPGADFARTLRRLNVPEPLIELLGDSAAHDPAHRPRDAAELAEKLAKLDTPGAAAPATEAPQIVACPTCGVSLRFRAGATALRCARCGTIFNPSAAPAPPARPAVVEARLSPPPPPPAPSTRRPEPVTRRRDDDLRPRRREDDDRDRPRRDRDDGPVIPVWVYVGGGVLAAVFVVIVAVLALRGRGPAPMVVSNPPVTASGASVPAGSGTPPGNPIPAPPPPVRPPVTRPGRAAPGAEPARHLRAFTHPTFAKADDVRFSPDGQKLLAVTPDGDVAVVLAADGSELLKYSTGVKGSKPSFVDGQTLLTAGDQGGAYTVSLSAGIGKALPLVGLTEKVTATAVQGAGKFLAAGGESGGVAVWSAADRKAFVIPGAGGGRPFAEPVAALAFGGTFGNDLAGAAGSTVKVFEGGGFGGDWVRKPPRVLLTPGRAFAVGWGQYNRGIVGGTDKAGVFTWTGADNAAAAYPAPGALSGFKRMAAGHSPFTARYAALAGDGRFGFWSGQAVNPVEPATDQPPANDLDFNRGGTLLAIAHRNGTVSLWFADRITTGDVGMTQIARLTSHGGEVLAVAWSPDGRELATVDRTGRVRVWGDLRAAAPAGAPPDVPAP